MRRLLFMFFGDHPDLPDNPLRGGWLIATMILALASAFVWQRPMYWLMLWATDALP